MWPGACRFYEAACAAAGTVEGTGTQLHHQSSSLPCVMSTPHAVPARCVAGPASSHQRSLSTSSTGISCNASSPLCYQMYFGAALSLSLSAITIPSTWSYVGGTTLMQQVIKMAGPCSSMLITSKCRMAALKR